jgi:hypothetical protein
LAGVGGANEKRVAGVGLLLEKEKDMASLSRSADGRHSVQFFDVDGKRRTIRLGKIDKRAACATKLRVEALLAAKIQNIAIDRDTATWLTGIGAELSQRLAAVGLIEARDETTLAAFTAKYIERRTDIKPRTVINLNQCRTRLIDFFGGNKPLRAFHAGDADAWLLWMKERYAAGTTERAVKRARQFFAAAVRSQLIPSKSLLRSETAKHGKREPEGVRRSPDHRQGSSSLPGCRMAVDRGIVPIRWHSLPFGTAAADVGGHQLGARPVLRSFSEDSAPRREGRSMDSHLPGTAAVPAGVVRASRTRNGLLRQPLPFRER